MSTYEEQNQAETCKKHKILWFWITKTCQIPQESVGLTGRGKLLSTTTKGEKHKTKMTKLPK